MKHRERIAERKGDSYPRMPAFNPNTVIAPWQANELGKGVLCIAPSHGLFLVLAAYDPTIGHSFQML